MVVIGLGFTDHEASAALVVDGELRTAIARERLTRLKKDGIRFGSQRLDLSPAIHYCLQQNRLTLSDVDLIVWNHIDHLALAEIENLLGQEGSPGFSGIPNTALPHHFAHACASFYLSPFSDAAVLVADGTGGSLERLVRHCEGPEPASIREGSVRIQNFLTEDPQTAQELESFYSCRDGSEWSILRKIVGRYGGVGGRYGAVSSLLFDSPLDAGKTMGLAEYGDPSGPHVFLEPVDEADMRAFRAARGDEWYRLKQRLQLWRTANALRNLKPNYEDPLPSGCAAVMQRESEEALLSHARWLRQNTDSRNLCLSGGVALNCVANSRLAREAGFEEIFVPPAPGDDGIAVGCALYGASVNGELRQDEPRRQRCRVFLGRGYPHDEGKIQATGLIPVFTEPNLAEWVAARIAQGSVVGWYQGGAELGPRALGHRSFLADPRNPLMRDHLNLGVKNREPFRPFAPVVLEDRVLEYFEELYPSYYMSFVATVRKEKRAVVPAITHIDGTARYQVLRKLDNPELYAVIQAFDRLTGVPLLLNTSFNRAGEPIVETPEQAARCVVESGADLLVLDGSAYENPQARTCRHA